MTKTYKLRYKGTCEQTKQKKEKKKQRNKGKKEQANKHTYKEIHTNK